MLGEPTGVERRDLVGRLEAQLKAQEVGESKMVVAEPGARDVDRDDQRVGLFEVVEQARADAQPDEDVARAGQ